MVQPPFLVYRTEAEYKRHYEQRYCNSAVTTHDGIRVYFDKDRFRHAFFESSNRDGKKDRSISRDRAKRMDWIRATLADPSADWYQGWDKKKKRYDPVSRVNVAYGDFVVVIRMRKKKDGTLKANFVTCYLADNSIGKIRQSPPWTQQDCLNAL